MHSGLAGIFDVADAERGERVDQRVGDRRASKRTCTGKPGALGMLDHQSLHVADLTKFGMQRVAQMNLLDDGATIQTTFVLPEAKNWCCTIYAIVFADVVERIGSSKNTLVSRCRQTDRILSRKFRDPQYDGTSDRELVLWQECFERHGNGEVYAAIGNTVPTEFGPCNIYLAVENMLLQKIQAQAEYKPLSLAIPISPGIYLQTFRDVRMLIAGRRGSRARCAQGWPAFRCGGCRAARAHRPARWRPPAGRRHCRPRRHP